MIDSKTTAQILRDHIESDAPYEDSLHMRWVRIDDHERRVAELEETIKKLQVRK